MQGEDLKREGLQDLEDTKRFGLGFRQRTGLRSLHAGCLAPSGACLLGSVGFRIYWLAVKEL